MRTTGSAIIMAVVLTSLLAIVGAIFLLSSRVDSVATSAISDNKDLNLAVDSIISRISDTLALDVPSVVSNNEYYDYPDPCADPWLACLEPYGGSVNPRWRQVSDIYGNLYPASQDLKARIIPDYNNNFSVFTAADADGDGVGDSIWVPLPDKTSSKGKTVYAAVRIVDNSAMLNVNTGYKFDSTTADGSSQMDINLIALSGRDNTHSATQKENDLLLYRCGSADANFYEQNVVWQYGLPVGGVYTPFDISDELKLRNRYIINYNMMTSRIEKLWTNAYEAGAQGPLPTSSYPFSRWPDCTVGDIDPNTYDYRHITTIQNLDRIIRPDGEKMYNVNSASDVDVNDVYNHIRAALDPNISDANAAQITANLIDYVDGPSYTASDSRYDPSNKVTVVYDSGGFPHFGFEQPCAYISELAQNFYQPDANEPNIIERSFAIEVYKPYPEDISPGPNDWRLVVGDNPPINFVWRGNTWFNVFVNDAYDRINVDFNNFTFGIPSPINGQIGVEPDVVLQWSDISSATSYNVYLGTDQADVFSATPNDVDFQGYVLAPTTTFDPAGSLMQDTTYFWRIEPIGPGIVTRGLVWRFTVSDVNTVSASIAFKERDFILLQRRVPELGPSAYVTVDAVVVPISDPNKIWMEPAGPNDPNIRLVTHSFQRDISYNKPIMRLWDLYFSRIDIPTLGQENNFFVPDSGTIQAHPANSEFTNVGEIGQLFYAPTYDYGGGGPDFTTTTTEPQMRINLALTVYQQLFNYLTVFDPINYGHDANETRIKGRININTAPWFVIAQLPWVSYLDYDLARKMTYYRDNVRGGYRSIGELMLDVNSSPDNIGYYEDKAVVPSVLMTPENGLGDIFEQRDAIFARISNLITVRSDVFTAYILVRIGENGPQKRVVAILDRSEYPAKPVKVIAIQPVPDPR